MMSAELEYRGHVYRVENGHWRGKDGHAVHFLTWVSDDLKRQGVLGEESSDAEIAQQTAAQIGKL